MLYYYRTTDTIEDVNAFYERKFGEAVSVEYDEHLKPVVHTYKAPRRWVLAHIYCQVISLGDSGMPRFFVSVYSNTENDDEFTEIEVSADWIAP